MRCKQVGAASLAQIVASTATYPHEVLRSHMHVEGTASPAGMAATFRQATPTLLPIHRWPSVLLHVHVHSHVQYACKWCRYAYH